MKYIISNENERKRHRLLGEKGQKGKRAENLEIRERRKQGPRRARRRKFWEEKRGKEAIGGKREKMWTGKGGGGVKGRTGAWEGKREMVPCS